MDALNWAQWALISWLTLGMFVTIYMVGKPRQATTPGAAVASTVISIILIALVVLS